jgi:hypothetical protein
MIAAIRRMLCGVTENMPCFQLVFECGVRRDYALKELDFTMRRGVFCVPDLEWGLRVTPIKSYVDIGLIVYQIL